MSALNRIPWLLTLALVCAPAASGCRDDKPPAQQGTGSNTSSGGSAGPSKRTTESPCEGTLSSIDEVFKLSKLERTTTLSDGVLRLNDWQRACAPSEIPPDLPAEIDKRLSESQRAFLHEKRFLQRDGEHLRDCLLDRALASYAPGTGATEIERVTHLFEHVVRAIGLDPAPLQNLPLTPYEVYLLGKGSAEDRAWVFAHVLAQLRIDAVLVLPQSSESPASGDGDKPFLVGVLLDGQVYLFDPRAGVPIPVPAGGSQSGGTAKTATLSQAASDPAVLKQLDAESARPYPIVAAQLQKPQVAIVTDAAFWSARMQGLQTQFVGARAMVIADPLTGSSDGVPGAFQRVASAGGEFWNADAILLWELPEKRQLAHAQMTQDQHDLLDGLLAPFGAFKVFGLDEKGMPGAVDSELHEDRAGDKKLHPGVRVIKRTTAGAQMQARLDHLEGNFSQAVREYLEVRDKCKDLLRYNVSLFERIRHNRAIEDATYWTGLCQYEQGEFAAAINTLVHYRKRPESKAWIRESRYLLALSQAAAGNHQAAIGELDSVEPTDPEYLGYRQLIRRWQAQR